MRSCCWHSHICFSQLGSHIERTPSRGSCYCAATRSNQPFSTSAIIARTHTTPVLSADQHGRRRRKEQDEEAAIFSYRLVTGACGTRRKLVPLWIHLQSCRRRHRMLGGSRREPTTGQVMCTDRIVFIKISREVNFQVTRKI